MAQPGSNSSTDQRDVPHIRPRTRTPAYRPAATLAGAIAALYFGRDVFLPIAVALLLTFALAPLVSALRRVGIPRIVAVIGSVVLAFAALALFSIIVATQVGELARNVTTYQFNILTKVRSLKDMGAGSGIVERLSGVIERVGREIEKKEAAAPRPGEAPQPESAARGDCLPPEAFGSVAEPYPSTRQSAGDHRAHHHRFDLHAS